MRKNQFQIDYEEKYGKGPFIAVDSIIINNGHMLFVRRKDNGLLAFPGGFVEPGEFLLEAAIRETKEETGIFLTQFVTGAFFKYYDDPNRDPRGDIKTHVFEFHIIDRSFDMRSATAGDDAKEVLWLSFEDVKNSYGDVWYADHGQIAYDYLKVAMSRSTGQPY